MSSIALDRIQTQVYSPESGQTTLDNVQKTASTATPSVTVENVKSKDADVLNTGKVKVQLDAPNAAVSDKVNDLTLKAMAQLQKIVDTIAKSLHAVADQTGSIAVKIIAGSADDFEVELAAITDKLKSAQNELKIQEVKVAKAKHEKEMVENQDKIKESEAAAKEAQKSGRDVYELIDSKTKEGPSKLLILPHFNGSGTPWCDLSSKGAILGLTLSSTRHDISKAILDSLVYELRINMERMRKAGIKIEEVRAVGGGAKSPIWLQIKADILGCKIITLKTYEAACLGAAIIAGTAAGGYTSLEEGVKIAVTPKDEYTPNPEMQELYEERYNIYKDLYATLKDINRRL